MLRLVIVATFAFALAGSLACISPRAGDAQVAFPSRAQQPNAAMRSPAVSSNAQVSSEATCVADLRGRLPQGTRCTRGIGRLPGRSPAASTLRNSGPPTKISSVRVTSSRRR